MLFAVSTLASIWMFRHKICEALHFVRPSSRETSGENGKTLKARLLDTPGRYRVEAKAILETECPVDIDNTADLLFRFCSTFCDSLPGGHVHLLEVFAGYLKLRDSPCRDAAGDIMHRAHDQFRAIPELEELSQSVIEMTQLILEEMAQNLAMLPCGGSHGQGKLLPEPKSTSRADIYLAALDRRIDQLVKHLAVLPDSNINLSMLHELETHVQETMDEIWALRNDAWQVVMKQVRNHLAKNGEFRAIVEENKVLFLQTPPKEVIELIIMAGNSNDAEVLRASVDKRKQRRIQGIRMVTKRFDEDPDFRKLLLHGPGGMDLTARIKLLPDMLDRQTEEGDRFITEVLFMLQWHFSKQKEMDSNSQPIDRAARQDNPQG